MQAHEVKAAVAAFSFVFILMAAYYILRPVRDAMASDWTDAEVSWLWTLNFFISTAIVAIYGVVISKVRFSKLVPSVYLFFALSFVIFFLLVQTTQNTVLIDKSFYLWVSVFALFHVSVFWSFMADTFNKDQAARLFSVIQTIFTLPISYENPRKVADSSGFVLRRAPGPGLNTSRQGAGVVQW